jgi:hypothetical protein
MVALNGEQRSVIIGSLLGDGTLLRTTAGWCFRVHHSLKQRALVEWKYNILTAVVRTPPRECGPGVYFRTVTLESLADLRRHFYAGARKRVPLRLLELELDALALAVWVMDDGSRDGGQIRLNTQCFTIEDAAALAALVRAKFGVEMRINLDKGKPRLRSTAQSTPKLVELIGPRTIPTMQHKLPARHRLNRL